MTCLLRDAGLAFDEVVNDPHLQARGLFTSIEHPSFGALPQIAFPVKLSATPALIRRPPPALGEQTEAILNDLGYSSEEIAGFRKAGVV